MDKIIFFALVLLALQTCTTSTPKTSKTPTTFGEDVTALKAETPVLVLEDGDRKVLLASAYQGRVMTSTANGLNGISYGWINHELIQKGEYQPHINAFGGEERFWLGPEGGQFGLYFKPGDPFDLPHWQTPGAIDTMNYPAVEADRQHARFVKRFKLQNYTGTTFDLSIDRSIRLLSGQETASLLDVPLQNVHWVAYESANLLRNEGAKAWEKNSGLLSIWLLSMMKAGAQQVVTIPYRAGGAAQVNDAYFGKIADERLVKKDSILFFKADAQSRGKIGLPPSIVKSLAGSYDAEKNTLTIVRFNYQGDTAYVNSMWEKQRFPYRGDVVNAYNDGPNDSGGRLGAFYELETSSPALALQPGQTYRHVQQIFHFEGKPEDLNVISKKVLGVELKDIPQL